MKGNGDDLLFGSLVLAVFLVFVFALGYAIYRFKNARLMRAWRPLLPLFEDARVADDGGGAAAGFLRGRHRGRRFDATMRPGIAVGNDSDGGGPRFNLFELALLDVAGGCNWSVRLRESRPGIRAAEWQLDADDPRLVSALKEAGVLDAVIALVRPDYTIARNGPVLDCGCADGRLLLRSDAGDGFAPPLVWVKRALGMLLLLADINARFDPPAADTKQKGIHARAALIGADSQ